MADRRQRVASLQHDGSVILGPDGIRLYAASLEPAIRRAAIRNAEQRLWPARTEKTLLLQVAAALFHLRAQHAWRPWGPVRVSRGSQTGMPSAGPVASAK